MYRLPAFLFVLLFALPAQTFAARLYFTIPDAPVHVGDVVPVSLMLDPEGDDVNAVEGASLLSSNLSLAGIREDSSIVSVWIERPGATGRASTFSGIMPGGFRGVLSPFWQGGHPGNVYTLLVEANTPGIARITLGPSGRALANDGKGTELPLMASDALFTVLDGPGSGQGVPKDTDPPEDFTPQVSKSPEVFNGAAFVAFSADDRGSGIDHYEVAETYTAAGNPSFVHAESPYRLTDQTLRSYIHVKAVDRAGNERIATVAPTHSLPWYASAWFFILIAVLVLALGLFIRRYRSSHAP